MAALLLVLSLIAIADLCIAWIPLLHKADIERTMSAFGGKADMAPHMSAYDPKRTLALHCGNGFDAGFGPYRSTRLSG